MKTFTLLVVGFLFGAVIGACSKSTAPVPAPQAHSPVDVATVQAAAVATQAEAANASQHAQAKTLAVPPSPVLAPRKVSAHAKPTVRSSDAEQAAYKKASFNAWRANCLSVIVDMKIASDQANGEISEWGSVLSAGVCNTQF